MTTTSNFRGGWLYFYKKRLTNIFECVKIYYKVSEIPNLLMVCYCYRENDEVIRIFSARRASKFEKNWYIVNGGSNI